MSKQSVTVVAIGAAGIIAIIYVRYLLGEPQAVWLVDYWMGR